MSDTKPTTSEPAKGSEGKLDEAIEGTFPASDPADTLPKPGSRKAEQEGQTGKPNP